MRFGKRRLFSGLSFDVTKGDFLAITGSNGSGKSTLLKIICGLGKPSNGEISLTHLDDPTSISKRRLSSGYLAPSANLYEGLSAKENLEFIANLRSDTISSSKIVSSIQDVGLGNRQDDLVSTFSSGMKQRLKLAAAMVSEPFLLILDEPYSNLDEAGFEIFDAAIEIQRKSGLVILATNNASIASQADRSIKIEDFPWEVDSPFANANRAS